MRFSQLFCYTLKEVPADAEVESHKLLLRAGMIRQLTAGIYDFLPLGLRSLRKIEAIVREEMNRSGAQEVFLPAIHPAELWMESGRWQAAGKELLKLKDRKDREYCFAPTHEEAITDLVRREIKSYRDLPKNLYQIQTKFRDEVRPRFGLMRAREFIMKDAYSFDVDDEGADRSYQTMFAAYERIFQRCGLAYRAVAADSGNIGGKMSQEFMVLAESGEDALLSCSHCGYAANIEKATRFIPQPTSIANDEPLPTLAKVLTQNLTSVEEVSQFLKVEPASLLKTLVYDSDMGLVVVVLPGDRELNEIALMRHIGANHLTLTSQADILKKLGAPMGYLGPLTLDQAAKNVTVVFDQAIRPQVLYAAGANQAHHHVVNAVANRDFKIGDQALIHKVRAGDACPQCQQALQIERGIEVGHVFKLGTKYSEAMGAMFSDPQGQLKPMIMGCYGIGVSRILAASIEQHHDAQGIVFPPALAPFAVVIVPTESKPGFIRDQAEAMYQQLLNEGIEVLLDDRDSSVGFKFKDADLIGIPIRITIGKKMQQDGLLEVKVRWHNESSRLEPQQLNAWLTQQLQAFPAPCA